MYYNVNVQYMIVERNSKRILYILTKKISTAELENIGKIGLDLQNKYENAYTIMKLY